MKPFHIPVSVGKLVSHLPSWPGSLIFVSAMNAVLTPRLPEDVQEMLVGKQLRLVVSDAGLAFNFLWSRGGFVVGHANVQPDLIIAANAYDFYLLSTRQEDPDTLFFSRRLMMQGDTELGLVLKNTLDAMELNMTELVKTHALSKLFAFIPKRS